MKLREQAYENFTEHLLAKNIRSGQFVSQRELVELTGLPLGAIRELIPRLEADGLIKAIPQRGMQVTHIDVELIRSAFQLRLILEKQAVANFTVNATDKVIDSMIDLHRKFQSASEGEMSTELLNEAQQVDWGFHDFLIDSLENNLISNVYRVNSIKIRLIHLERTRLTPTLLSPVMSEHLAVLDAIKNRDAELAVEQLSRHITGAMNRALGL